MEARRRAEAVKVESESLKGVLAKVEAILAPEKREGR